MSLFVAGREAVCAVAQIIGGGFSAGEGKLKVTPGWKARHDAFFLSAFQLKTTDPLQFHRSASESSLTGGAESFWQTRTLIPPSLPINLLYPGLNMSRVDVTLRLCRGQTEYGGGLLRLSALVSATQGTWGEETGRGVFCAEIEGGKRGDGGQLKDHPMRGDLKAGVWF